MTNKMELGPAACALSLAVGLAFAPAARGATLVWPGNMGNWAFDNRDTNGTVGADPTAGGSMVTGPANPPIGIGSANLHAGDGTQGGDGAGELRNTGYAGTALSAITALSYSTYVTQNNGQQFPYLGLMISTTGGTTPDDILFFEPPYQTPGAGNPALPDQGATSLATWQTWNALTGGWWDSNGHANPGSSASLAPANGVEPLSYFDTLYPSATIVNASGLGGVRFDVGFASATDQFNGYVDNFTIGVNGHDTTYNFDVPEPAGIGLLGVGLVGVGLIRRKRASR